MCKEHESAVYDLICEVKDIIEENEITEVPTFFISRICNGDSTVINDFDWYVKMMNLYKNQFELKKYRDCQKTIKELEERLGYDSIFYKLEDNVINLAQKTATFIYNGRDDVTWEELPLEVRQHDYPYYFNKNGSDCYPYCTDIHDLN